MALFLAADVSLAQQGEGGGSKSRVDYETVEAAYTALQSDNSADVTHYEGWVIFKLKRDGKYVLWSFTPPQHPAHPAVIRREIVKNGEELLISMDALCESSKLDCDDLIEQFKQINDRLRGSVGS